jgi:plastocyanin
MKNNGANRRPLLGGTLKALGLVGVLGMAGAIVLIGPLAGSGCNEGSGGNGGHGGFGGAIGTGGFGGVIGTGGGGGAATDAGTDGVISATATLVTIQSFMYSPLNFTVAPGATVTVQNNDSVPHSLTSEAAMNNFTLGAVNGVTFDTGIIPAGGNATITIPATAPSGTVIMFFCKVHTAAMPQGMITIQ